MDKKTKKLLEKYSISEDILSAYETSIEIDVSGRRSEIISMVQQCNLSFEDSDEDNMNGLEGLNVFGSIASILSLLTYVEQHYGSYCMIGVTIATTATIIYLNIPDARKTIIEQFKSKIRK